VGRASALRFASEGAKLVCADLRDDWVADTVKLVQQAGGIAVAVHCDVAVEADVEGAVRAAVSNFGRLDVMFNNAGVTGMQVGKTFEDFSAADFTRLVDINFRGVFNGCKYAVRQMKAQGGGGVIVNTGSIAGMVGFGSVVYGATKGAVNQLTKGVAIECAAQGIRCNAICPGTVDSPSLRQRIAAQAKVSGKTETEVEAAFVARQPMGRLGRADEIAALAVYLASDASAFVTGTTQIIDGGFAL
jgi:NAD(P)-dependent dehydrogenase (short-subunit alcohol dehydrogenase family)